MSKYRISKQAFTLVELLVVIASIGILVGLSNNNRFTLSLILRCR